MTNVLIGLPVYKREWVLPLWLKAIEAQDFPLSNIGFIFELGPDDDETHNVLLDWQAEHPELLCFQGHIQMHSSHQAHPEGVRCWSRTRYMTMIDLRNNLLERASAVSDKFDYYFSLDSDIILDQPDSISRLIAYAEQFPGTVVSPLSYMTPDGTMFPSIMTWKDQPGGAAFRDLVNYPIGQPFLADVVMAAVLMPRQIYTSVRYRFHPQGEDLGFAYALHRCGFKSLAASDISCSHIMHQSMLETHLNKPLTTNNS